MNKIEDKDTLRKLILDLKTYTEKRIEIVTLEYQDKASGIISAIISDGIGLILVLIGFLFVLVAAGIGLGYLFDNMMLGFLTLAIIILIPGGYIFKFKRNKIKRIIRQKISDFIDRNVRNNK